MKAARVDQGPGVRPEASQGQDSGRPTVPTLVLLQTSLRDELSSSAITVESCLDNWQHMANTRLLFKASAQESRRSVRPAGSPVVLVLPLPKADNTRGTSEIT